MRVAVLLIVFFTVSLCGLAQTPDGQNSLADSGSYAITKTNDGYKTSDIVITSSRWSGKDLMRYAGNIHQFNQIYPQEKVYLQFDNTGYYQGETIWFKAFVVNASGLTRARSTVLYVDLLSPSGVLLEQKKLKILAGQADGCFILMDGSTEQARELRGVLPYPSGYYEIRAYTQYMLNFVQHLEFSRVIPVFREPVTKGYFGEQVMDNSVSEIEDYRPRSEKSSNTVNVEIFPESGNLIKGKPCRLAFKATNGNGQPVNGVLSVSASALKHIYSGATLHDGMGSVTVPSGWSSLTAEFNDGENTYKVRMPQTERKGYSLMVTQSADSLFVQISSPERSYAEDLAVSITCRGALIGYKYFNSDRESLSISKDGWPIGVCQLTLYNFDEKKICTRYFFNHRSDFRMPELTAIPEKESYSPYEPIKIDFDLKNGHGVSFRDRFCVSVRDASPSLATIYADNLATTLLLSSDLKGLINNPRYYFESDDEEHRQAMDLLMLVQGWERYDWMYMSGNSYFTETHRMEDSLSVNGWITAIRNKRKLKGINTYITILPHNDSAKIEYGMYPTDEIGYFGFDTKDYYGTADLVMLLENNGNLAKNTGAKMILQRSDLPVVRSYLQNELTLKKSSYSPWTNRFSTVSKDSAGEVPLSGVLLPTVEVRDRRKYVDYFTFRAFDVEKDVETVLDFGEWPKDLMGYFLDKGYSVLPWEVIGESNPENDYGIEGYAFINTGYIGNFPVFWYVHDSQKLWYFDYGEQMAGSAQSGKMPGPWTIDTEDIESVLVFDSPASLGEISESVPIFMNTLERNMNSSAELVMRGNLTSQKYLLVDVLMKDDYQLKTKQEKRNRGKRITTLRGFNRPVQFYSPEYPDGPVEGTEDYRRTLYWNPNVITDSLGHAQIEFYNNSYSTRFNVSGAGITAGGSPYVLDMDF